MTKGLFRLAGLAAMLYAARRYYRNWGTTKHECRMPLPGDELIKGPAVQSTAAVFVDAPAEAVWPWLVQIGQDRAGLYSHETLENLFGMRYRNADRIHPEWQHLAPGDVVRLVPEGWMGLRDGVVLRVVEVEHARTIVLRTMPSDPWDAVWSFHLIPYGDDRCRLLVRMRVAVRHAGQTLTTELAGPAKALITRGMLLGVKRRAEQRFRLQQQGREDRDEMTFVSTAGSAARGE